MDEVLRTLGDIVPFCDFRFGCFRLGRSLHVIVFRFDLLGLGLLLRLGCFIRTEFKFQIENQPGHFNEPLLLFIGERDIGIVLGFKECFLLLPKRLQLLLELLFVLR